MLLWEIGGWSVWEGWVVLNWEPEKESDGGGDWNDGVMFYEGLLGKSWEKIPRI